MTREMQATFFIWPQFHIYITPYVLSGKCTWEIIYLYVWSISDNHLDTYPQNPSTDFIQKGHIIVQLSYVLLCITNLLGWTTDFSLFNVISKYDLSIWISIFFYFHQSKPHYLKKHVVLELFWIRWGIDCPFELLIKGNYRLCMVVSLW